MLPSCRASCSRSTRSASLAAGNAAILQAVEGATASLASLNTLLDLNRALTKVPPQTKVGLDRLFEAAAARVRVTLRGALPARTVEVAAPMVTHALSLLIDLGAGVEDYKRIADVTGTSTGVTIVDRGVTVEPDAHVLVGLAAYFLARDGGDLRCSRDGFSVRL